MLTQERIAELEAFDGGGERVLSVYLDLDPRRQPRHDQGGASQSHFQHHHDLHVLWRGHHHRVPGGNVSGT